MKISRKFLRRLHRTSSFLSHPLTLLIIGALISSYLIPNWNQQQQNHQKELDLKSELIAQISESTTNILTDAQFAEFSKPFPKDAYDKADRAWEAKDSIIQSKIKLYFLESTLLDRWKMHSSLVSDFHALSGIQNDVSLRKELLERFKKNFINTNIEWDKLANTQWRKTRGQQQGISEQAQQYINNWNSLKQELIAEGDVITERILNSSTVITR